MSPSEPATQPKTDIDALLPSDLITEDEQVLLAVKPSPWSIAFLSFRTLVLAAAAAAAVLAAGPLLHLGRLTGRLIEGCGVAVLARVGFAVLQWASRSYVLTDRRVIRIRGVFTIDIFQCALERVQNTFLVLTLAQRLFGLGNIEFTTAGTGGVEAVWRHVRHPLQVHEKLLRALNAAVNRPGAARPNP